MTAFVWIELALDIIERLAPMAQQELKAGLISPEREAAVRGRYNAMRQNEGALFAGDEWRQSVTVVTLPPTPNS